MSKIIDHDVILRATDLELGGWGSNLRLLVPCTQVRRSKGLSVQLRPGHSAFLVLANQVMHPPKT